MEPARTTLHEPVERAGAAIGIVGSINSTRSVAKYLL